MNIPTQASSIVDSLSEYKRSKSVEIKDSNSNLISSISAVDSWLLEIQFVDKTDNKSKTRIIHCNQLDIIFSDT